MKTILALLRKKKEIDLIRQIIGVSTLSSEHYLNTCPNCKEITKCRCSNCIRIHTNNLCYQCLKAKPLLAKYLGSLYHLTGFKGLKHIVQTNALEAFISSTGISVTRDKNLNSFLGAPFVLPFKLELNGEKLSNTFKMDPFLYKNLEGVPLREEHEERIKVGKISNIWKYTKKLIFIAKNIKKSQSALRYLDIDKFRTNYLPAIAAKGIPFYVQHGTRIMKDDTFLKEYKFIE